MEASLQARDEDDGLPVGQRILKLYASALMVMREFFDDVAEGVIIMPPKVKRLAQGFVGLSEHEDPALLGLTTMANAHRDDAGRAVQAAILTVVIARQVPTDRLTLARLTMSALVMDAGRVKLLGPEGRDHYVALADDVNRKVPPTTAEVCLATGGVNIPNALRTVVSHEATWLERTDVMGPLYKKSMSPLIETQILHTVRVLLDKLAPRDATVETLSPLDALQKLAEDPNVDPLHVKLVIAAVGLIPTGSVIEFETGEWGVVIGPSAEPTALDRPRVRLVTDRNGRGLNPPREVDLGAPAGGRVFPKIANILPADRAKFNVSGVFLNN